MRAHSRRFPAVLAVASLFAAGAASGTTRINIEGARTAEEQACFGPDPGAGSGDWDAHDRWARDKDLEALRQNLVKKIDLIYRCPAVSGEEFADFFADMSVVMAKVAPSADCFGNDAGAASTDRAAHRGYAVKHTREEVRNHLTSKVSAVSDCANEEDLAPFFADASLLIASAPVGGGLGLLPPTVGGTGAAGSGAVGGSGGSVGGGLAGNNDGFQVWVKVAPCSINRRDWISVARVNPSLGTSPYHESASRIVSTAVCTHTGRPCTFDEAMLEADSIRTASSFTNYCCRDFSVWSKPETGAKSVVLGKFGTAGPGWIIDKPNLCCEEAAVEAGFTPAFCTESGGGPNLQKVCGSREWSVWENTGTKKRALVLGRFGNAGPGWILVSADLCCADAAAMASFPDSFCTGGAASGGSNGSGHGGHGGSGPGIGQVDLGGGIVGHVAGGDGGSGGSGQGGNSGSAGSGTGPTFTGTWDTSFGKMTLTQSGTSVSGSYDYYGGKLQGTLEGNILKCTWSQSHDGVARKGKCSFELASDGNSFSGGWNYILSDGSDGNGGGWGGKRVE